MKNTEKGLLSLAFTFDYYVKDGQQSKEGYVAFSKHYLSEEVGKCLKQMQRIIDCRLVDYIEIEIDGVFYDIWFDEEFLLKRGNIPMLYLNDDTVIFGNFLVRRSEEYYSTSLEKEDILHILNFYEQQFLKLQEWCMRNHNEVMHISNEE